VGFESASWVVPDAKPAPPVSPEQPAQTVQV
jgi:hypothetical protein